MSNQALHPAVESVDDLSVLQSEGRGKIVDAATERVTKMILGADDIDVFGRMTQGSGGDPSEFDCLERNEVDQEGDPSEAEVFLGDGERTPAPFTPPNDHFPLFAEALRHHRARSAKPRALRIDTEESFQGLVADATVKELERHLDTLQRAYDEHVADPLAHPHTHDASGRMHAIKEDILGAAEAVSDLQAAKTTDEALDAMPKVPIDLPEWAEDKVKAWKDGDMVVCCVCFMTTEGEPRVATMAAKPKIDEEAVVGWARATGAHPITILGAAEHLADSACAKKLVKEIAGAALEASRRADVCVMGDEPVMLTSTGDAGEAPVAALVSLQEMADAGHGQAKHEVAKLDAIATTPAGQVVVAPALTEARKRLKTKKPSLLGRIGRALGLLK